jgi:DNA polymerase III delta prime subunit
MNHTLLNEKYRPQNLDTFVGNENVKQTISQYLSNNDIQNFIFYGPAGSGKTTLAKIIIKNLECDYLYINASDERGIETIRNKVVDFASVASFKPIKIIILDEADFLTIQAQASLRNIIETFSRNTRFVMTCNFIERIIDPLQSRCQVLKIVPQSKQEIARHVHDILCKEDITFELEDIGTIVNKHYPDLRKILNTVQFSINDGKLQPDKNVLVSSNYIKNVIKELSGTKPNFRNLRQIIADSGVNDYEELFRALFDYAPKYAPELEGSIAVILNDHLYQSNFRIDKEINIMSAIAKIIKLKKSNLII